MPRQSRKKSSTGIYTDSTDYLLGGSLTLKNGRIDKYQFEEGYCQAEQYVYNTSQDVFTFCYYITDHLGSTRMVVDSNDSIRETISYYPFGSEIRMENPALLTGGTSHPFRFTGKELDRLNSLNMYDFGARWYDVAGVPMWTSIDPLCEKYYSLSPYNYCGNNPVKFVDVKGEKIVDPNGKVVRITWNSNNSLVFSNNANPNIIRVANAMNLTKTGRHQLHNLIQSDIKVTIDLSDATKGNGHSYTYGETIQGNNNRKNNYGTYYKNGKFGITEAHITIFLGSIKKSIATGSGFKLEGLTMEQALGAVAGHETVHATDKDEINEDKTVEQNTGDVRTEEVREKKPREIEDQIIEESKRNNDL